MEDWKETASMIVLRIHCPVWMAEKYLEQFQPDRFKDAWEAAYQPLMS